MHLPFQGTEVTGAALSPDGRVFATSTGFGIVRLWQTDSLRPVGPVHRQSSRVAALAFSPNGRRLAMGTESDGIRVVEMPASLEAGPGARLHSEISMVQYAPARGEIFAGTQTAVVVLGASTGHVQASLENPENYGLLSTALSADGKSLAVGRWSGVLGSWRGRTEVWDAVARKRRWQSADLPDPVGTVAYSRDGKRLFSSCNLLDREGAAALWEVSSGRRLRGLLGSLGKVRVRQAVFHPGGRLLLLACDDGRAHLWDVETDSEAEPGPLVHASAVTACAFDAAGERTLTGCRDGTAGVWDMKTGRLVVGPMQHDAEVKAAAFSPDGKTLLTGSLDGTARFWDAGSGSPLGPTLWHADGVHAVAFHPNGRRVLTGGKDRTVRQWHTPVPPREGSPEEIRRWAELLSGMKLDEQGVVQTLSRGEE
jgi:WD40 repeat protein